jgi:2-methylaconitate cis-trans-isomerase PrpF
MIYILMISTALLICGSVLLQLQRGLTENKLNIQHASTKMQVLVQRHPPQLGWIKLKMYGPNIL